MATSAVSAKQFPIIEGDLLDDLLVFALNEELAQVMSGAKLATPVAVVDSEVRRFENKYELRSFHGLTDSISAGRRGAEPFVRADVPNCSPGLASLE